jgi:hypothetical protein
LGIVQSHETDAVLAAMSGSLGNRKRKLMAGLATLSRYHVPMTDGAYPGVPATPQQLLALADEYRLAAGELQHLHRKGAPLSLAPFRLVAIHAVELYLSAVLLAHGRQPSEIRALGHDLPTRAEFAQGVGLKLRKRTLEHLRSLCANREYLVSRYSHPPQGAASQVNQLLATLNEVASKTVVIVTGAAPKPRLAQPSR